MKARSQIVLGGAAVLMLAGCCTFLGLHCGRVDINKYSVAIYPGTRITSDDEAALRKILKHRDNDLWRLSRIENGHAQTEGALSDMLVDQNLLAEASSAISHGVTYYTVQIGLSAHPDRPQASTSSHPTRTGASGYTSHPNAADRAAHPNSHPDYAAAKRLVEEVTPILKKYSRE